MTSVPSFFLYAAEPLGGEGAIVIAFDSFHSPGQRMWCIDRPMGGQNSRRACVEGLNKLPSKAGKEIINYLELLLSPRRSYGLA